MKAIKVLNGKVLLYSQVVGSECKRYESFAVLPKSSQEAWEGENLYVIDWKISDDRKTVVLTYQTRNDLYAPVHDDTLACELVVTPLTKPNKSKNWVWREWSYCWQNTKTGERVTVL